MLVALNREEIKNVLAEPQKSAIKPYTDKYNWEGVNYQSEKDDCKKSEKNNQQFILMFCMIKKYIYIRLLFQNITQIVKKKLFF